MLNELSKKMNTGAREKGFWDSMYKSVDYVGDHIAEYGLSNEMVKATKDAFIAQKIGLIMSECGEALEAMRKPNYEANGYGIGIKDSFVDEIADTIIRLLDLCGELEIDIDAQMEWKMDYNKSREAKHGKEF